MTFKRCYFQMPPMVTDCRGHHRQNLLLVREFNLKACTGRDPYVFVVLVG